MFHILPSLRSNQKGFFSVGLAIVALLVLIGVGFFAFQYTQKPTSSPVSSTTPKKIGILQHVAALNPIVASFQTEMATLGYKEGVNVSYDVKHANGDISKLNGFAKELIGQNIDLIFAVPTTSALSALNESTRSGKLIPIVFASADRPIQAGIVKEYRSSGNNTTGVAFDNVEITNKKLEFLKNIKPETKKIGIISTLSIRSAIDAYNEVNSEAAKMGMTVVQYKVNAKPGPETTARIKEITSSIKPGEIDALITIPDTNYSPENIALQIELGKRIKIPTIFFNHEDVTAGGLLAYNFNFNEVGKQAAIIADKVLKGTAPSNIPVEFPARHTLSINKKTADEIGIVIPTSMLNIATNVIE